MVRVIVVNADPQAAPELRAHLLGIEGVKIVCEIDEPALLAQTLERIPAELLLVHLDPNPAALMEQVAPLIEAHKERLAAIAMSEDRDAELVMKALRAGVREFLWKPFPPEQLAEIIRRMAGEGFGGDRRVGRLISVCGACGGMGATSLAVNLAVELAQLEQQEGTATGAAQPRVALVDLDLRFGQVAMFLDAQPTYTLADLCETPEQIDVQTIERAMCAHPAGVHLLAHPADFAKAECITAGQTAGVLTALLECYDFVVADVPLRLDPTARAVLDMSDLCLLVVQLMVPPVRNAERLLQEIRRSGYSMERMKLVCNRFGRESGYLVPADVEATLGCKLDWLLPDDWKTAAAAVNMGTPVVHSAPKSKLRQAYHEMASAVAKRDATSGGDNGDGRGAPKKRLFSFLAGQK